MVFFFKENIIRFLYFVLRNFDIKKYGYCMSWGNVMLVDILFFKENIIIFFCILLLESLVKKNGYLYGLGKCNVDFLCFVIL